MEKFDVHFCLVSAQALANYLPVLDKALRPKRAVLFVTKEMESAAKYLSELFEKQQVKVTAVKIEDAYDITAVRDLILEHLNDYLDQRVVLNLTGGTKTMAIAAQEAFYFADKPYFYLNHRTNEIQTLHPKVDTPEFYKLETSLKLNDCLKVHGFSISQADAVVIKEEQKELIDFLVKYNHSNSPSVKSLNYMASELKRMNRLSTHWSDFVGGPESKALFKEILERFETAGYLKYDVDTVTFTDADSRDFANGLWFEYHVARCVPPQGKDITDIKMNVVVQSGDVKNELDVAAIAHNALHIIECKTRQFAATKGNDEQIREAIYKLETLKRLGGLNSKCMLVSYLPIENQAFKKRAADSGIKIIDGTQLNNLKAEITSWMR